MKPGTRRIGISLGLAAMLLASAAAVATAEDSELVIFDWSGYEAPEFHPGYVEKHGQSPTFTFFGDEDEAFEKIRSGFKTDLAHPCSQSVVKWREAGLLEPLDTSKIEGWKDMNPGIMAMKNLATTAGSIDAMLLASAWPSPQSDSRTLATSGAVSALRAS